MRFAICSEIEVTRPNVLVLASEVLFQHFFTERSLRKLEEVSSWSRSALREDSPELRSEIANADVLMTTWHSPFLTADMLGEERRVKLIAHCGGEVKSRVAEEIFEFVTITNAADPMARGVAEMALALALTLVRRIPDYAREMREGVVRTNAEVSEGETFFGRRVGIVGFGRIGRAFARLLPPFGVDVLVSDPYAPEHSIELDELVASCSVVVICAALTPETRGMFDKRRLSLLMDGAFLINVARGGLIEMDALLDELRRGRITVALDVTDPLEPLPVEHELRRLPNAILTPHIAAGGIEMRREIGAIAVEEVVRFAKGEPPLNRVTSDMLATMT
ncbi:MAG TPA: hydroxyacid dehydrogenase [Pyrinomonadaceae bacterium]|nr:hydroxyacid dehydrogenase [Pyrinomonadaceae bacterium]